MATTTKTHFSFSTHVWTLVNSIRGGCSAEPVLDHAGCLPRDRSGLGPVMWFLASAVAVAAFMAPESGKLRQRIGRILDGDIEAATPPTNVDLPVKRAPPARKSNGALHQVDARTLNGRDARPTA